MRFTTLSHLYYKTTKIQFPELGLGSHIKKIIGAFHFSLAVPVSDSVEKQVCIGFIVYCWFYDLNKV
jgi:hypothetical protein